MKKLIILLAILFASCTFCRGQGLADTIYKMEYFIDVDPGFGAGTNIPIPPDTLIEIDFDALLTSVSPGIHFIGIRAMNGTYQWGQTHIFRFLKDDKISVDALPDLSRAEYFVDTDDGYGYGTPISIPADSMVTANPVINLSTLPEGFHILGVRAKDQDAWGQTHLFRFMRDNKITNDLLPALTEVEYFIDTDTGYSQCGTLTITSDSMLNLAPLISLSGLPTGFHILGIRAKDPKTWGQTHLFRFMNDNMNNIQLLPFVQKVEYFIDSDPGFGNSTPLTLTTDSMLNISPNISMAGLSPGFHILGIRSKDPRAWGHTHLYRFVNNDEPPTLHNLSLIEYFVDTEPGFGNGTQIYPTQDSLWDTTFVANLTAMPLGSHYLAVRAMDTMQKFSHTFIHPFNIVEPPYAYNFSGGGSLCAGSSGLNATLSDSETGISYILFKNGVPIDTLPGTDTNLVWTGLTGGIYTVTGYYTATPHIFAPMNGTVTVTENPLPTVTCPPALQVCISTDSLALSGATPMGGTYSGTYVSNNYFYPPQAGSGAHNITYTYTDANTCTNFCTFNATVHSLPIVTCPTAYDVCVSTDSMALLGSSPSGGTYSGTGVGNGYFKPAVAGSGTHSITYAFTDGNTCTNSCSFNITVNNLPVLSCPADFSICAGTDSVLLTGATPAGGSYSGTGVSNGYFHPALSGTGDFIVTYAYTDANSCTNTCTFTVTVLPLPSVTCPSDFDICVNADSVLITGALPAGGTYSGNGVGGGYFLPWAAGAGNHIISYTYTGTNGCDNVCTFEIVVHDIPVLNCGPDLDVCINTDTFLLISSMLPPGGTYSGTGVINNYFSPALAGIGSHSIMYAHTDSNSCMVVCMFDINVHALPQITASSNSPVCQGETISLTAGGGTAFQWSGPQGFSSSNATASINNADLPNAGSYSVTVTNLHNCSSDSTLNVIVNNLPTVSITASSNHVCEGESSTLTATGSTGITSYLWNTTASTAQIVVIPTLPSSTYSLTVTNSNTCTQTESVTITVNNNPVVTLDGTPETCTDKGDGAVTANITTPTTTPYNYTWLFGGIPAGNGSVNGTSIVFNNASAGDYSINITDALGCEATGNYTLSPSTVSCHKGARVPQIFSPNGDGQNDILYVYGQDIENLKFSVYARYGNLLFESNDMNAGWDGRFNNKEMPAGVYAYVLHVTYKDGSSDILSGDVTLIR